MSDSEEIAEWKKRMDVARMRGHQFAFRDAKKHYDKLVTKERRLNHGLQKRQ